ncbi:GNAT family N-acetyltransferase [Phenylobacterium sp.]|uniref:GNAT family N-acetyltransferase n=1 Tax=Phenylobacterium sp. TaxID=1871053 RepID=UPI0028116D97|nr:GNAT family N-acetyltransferase [Phenylobacterium sp.]
MTEADVESVERATVAAVAPAEVMEIAGWLVPLDRGAVGRAKSAAPLSHQASPEALDEIVGAYVERELPPAFRIADVDGLAGVRAALEAREFAPAKPTWVKVADSLTVAGFCEARVELMETPDADWGEVFLGEGFDPADGASRVATLSRSPDALYAAVREEGRTLAVGAVSFGHGWAGVHGMRTSAQARGRGYAGRILAAFGGAALTRDVRRMFLQVEEANPARSLYRKAGFEAAWRYSYWARPS